MESCSNDACDLVEVKLLKHKEATPGHLLEQVDIGSVTSSCNCESPVSEVLGNSDFLGARFGVVANYFFRVSSNDDGVAL